MFLLRIFLMVLPAVVPWLRVSASNALYTALRRAAQLNQQLLHASTSTQKLAPYLSDMIQARDEGKGKRSDAERGEEGTMVSYWFEGDIRHVNPYLFEYKTHAKGRWVNRELKEVSLFLSCPLSSHTLSLPLSLSSLFFLSFCSHLSISC